VNVYITARQRNRMREFDAVINWSQVASRAFDAAMDAHVQKVRMYKLAHRWMRVGPAPLSAPATQEDSLEQDAKWLRSLR
jgi:hypothetical protein